jgi:hypothetical protein
MFSDERKLIKYQGGEMLMLKITFPEVRALKAKHGLTDTDLGKVIGNTYSTFSKKMRRKYDFSLGDMLKITNFFIGKGEKVDPQMLFFDWILSIEE